jgi:hypothetical protein
LNSIFSYRTCILVWNEVDSLFVIQFSLTDSRQVNTTVDANLEDDALFLGLYLVPFQISTKAMRESLLQFF